MGARRIGQSIFVCVVLLANACGLQTPEGPGSHDALALAENAAEAELADPAEVEDDVSGDREGRPSRRHDQKPTEQDAGEPGAKDDTHDKREPDPEPGSSMAAETKSPQQQEAKVAELPYRESDMGMMAQVEGTLAADRDLDGGCVWLELDAGKVSLLWHRPYRVRFPGDGSPAEVLSQDGEVMFRDGDHIELAGGAVEDGYGTMDRCQVSDDRPWWVWVP